MKKFFLKVFSFLFIVVLALQLFYGKTPSIFNIRVFYGFTMNKIGMFMHESIKDGNIKDEIFLNPDGDKINVNVNNIGFSAPIDFYSLKVSSDDICIIGDSFIASYNCGTDKSISYFLNKKNSKIKVYNFGVQAGNINDYYKIYNEFGLVRLKKVFILITGTNDLMYKKPLSRKYKVKELLGFGFLNNYNIKNFFLDKINMETFALPNFNFLKSNYSNIVFVFHKGIHINQVPPSIDNIEILDLNNEYLETFSDGHYTGKGNSIVADRIQEYIEKTK